MQFKFVLSLNSSIFFDVRALMMDMLSYVNLDCNEARWYPEVGRNAWTTVMVIIGVYGEKFDVFC